MNTRTTNRTRIAALTAALVAATLSACSSADDSAESSSGWSGSAEVAPADDYDSGAEPYATDEASFEMASTDMISSGRSPETPLFSSGSLIVDASRQVIIDGDASIRTVDVAVALRRLQALVDSRGGLITSISSSTASEEGEANGWASMVIRIEPNGLDALLADIDNDESIGSITSESRSAQDVTEQLIEFDVRIENLRDSIDTVRRIMSEAVDIGDVVLLESELNRRQTELEVMLARRADIAGRVAMATLHLHLYESGAPIVIDDPHPIIAGLGDGWSAMVSSLGTVAYASAASSPLIALGLVALIIVRRRRPAAGGTTRSV